MILKNKTIQYKRPQNGTKVPKMGQELKNLPKAAKAFENPLIMQLMQRNNMLFWQSAFLRGGFVQSLSEVSGRYFCSAISSYANGTGSTKPLSASEKPVIASHTRTPRQNI